MSKTLFGTTVAALVSLLCAACPAPQSSGCDATPGNICTWAGTGQPGFNGDGLPLLESRLYWPVDVTFLSTGEAVVLDWNNHKVRIVDENQTFQTIIGTDFVGDGPDDLSDLTPPGAPGTTVALNHPTQILELDAKTLLLVSWHNHKLRLYDRDTGLVLVLCGRGAGFDGDGPIADARLNQPSAARLGPAGGLYILDQRNQRIRFIDQLDENGTIQTVVGTGTSGFSGDGGDPLQAEVSFPTGSNPPPGGSLAFADDGRLYFADTLNNRVRRVDFSANLIETVVGDGDPQVLDNPRDVERGPDGRIYIADERNHRILALDPADDSVEVVAGTGVSGFDGDGGPATEATLNRPAGVGFDAAGNLYIADAYNHRIRVVYGEVQP